MADMVQLYNKSLNLKTKKGSSEQFIIFDILWSSGASSATWTRHTRTDIGCLGRVACYLSDDGLSYSFGFYFVPEKRAAVTHTTFIKLPIIYF